DGGPRREVRRLHVVAPRFARRVGANRQRVELAQIRGVGLRVDGGPERDVDVVRGNAGALLPDDAADLAAVLVFLLGPPRDGVLRLHRGDGRVVVGEIRLRLARGFLGLAGGFRGLAGFLL